MPLLIQTTCIRDIKSHQKVQRDLFIVEDEDYIFFCCLLLQFGSQSLVVVEEASSRYSSTFNSVEEADHISVCRPMQKTSRSFLTLVRFLEDICTESKVKYLVQFITCVNSEYRSSDIRWFKTLDC
jgi:hypothetical protein